MAAEASRTARPGGIARTALVVATTAAVYVAAAEIGLSLASIAVQVSPVWPPTGIALAATVLLGPRRTWLGIAIGAFVANLTVPVPVGTAPGSRPATLSVVGARLLTSTGVVRRSLAPAMRSGSSSSSPGPARPRDDRRRPCAMARSRGTSPVGYGGRAGRRRPRRSSWHHAARLAHAAADATRRMRF
jgi:hypothetical protein